MKSAVIGIRSMLGLLIIVGFIFLIIGLSFPSQTFAAEVSVQTAQLLPLGSNTCTPPSISGFTPYIYNGALHSLEFSVSDSSYVAIIGSAGSTGIPLNQMSRHRGSSGGLRIHATTATTPIRDSLTVTVTMLSSKGPGEPLCVSVISTAVDAEGVLQPAPAPAPAPGPVPPASTGGVSKPTPSPAPSAGVTPTPPAPTTTATGTKVTSSPIASIQNALKDMCTGGGALRLWLILLVAYTLIVIAAIVGQPKMPLAIRTQEWIAAIIVVPFLLLFGLWYFVESCRTSAWIPVIATVIALAGLSAAFWERQSTASVINLPEAKK